MLQGVAISDICLIVEDLARMIEFYESKVGLPLRRLAPGFADFSTDGVTLALWQRGHLVEHVGLSAAPPESGVIRAMCALQLDSFDHVLSLHRALSDRGIAFLKEPRLYVWNAYACYFEDPEHNLWEIYAWGANGHAGLLSL